MTNYWQLRSPRKNGTETECTECKEKIDRAKDYYVLGPGGETWCISCGEEKLEARQTAIEAELPSIRRAILKLIVAKREKE